MQSKKQSKKKMKDDYPVLDTLILTSTILAMSIILLLVRVIPIEYSMDRLFYDQITGNCFNWDIVFNFDKV